MMKLKIRKADILILFILLFSFAFYSHNHQLKVNSADSSQSSNQIMVTMYIKSVMDFIPANIRVGDPVVDKDTGILMGKVSKIEVLSEEGYSSRSDGTLVKDSREGYSSAVIYVEAQGKISDMGLLISNYNYTIGRTFNIAAGVVMVRNIRIIEFKSIEE